MHVWLFSTELQLHGLLGYVYVRNDNIEYCYIALVTHGWPAFSLSSSITCSIKKWMVGRSGNKAKCYIVYSSCLDPLKGWVWFEITNSKTPLRAGFGLRYTNSSYINFVLCMTCKFELQARDNYRQVWSLRVERCFTHVLVNCSGQLNCQAILYTHGQMNILLQRMRVRQIKV